MLRKAGGRGRLACRRMSAWCARWNGTTGRSIVSPLIRASKTRRRRSRRHRNALGHGRRQIASHPPVAAQPIRTRVASRNLPYPLDVLCLQIYEEPCAAFILDFQMTTVSSELHRRDQNVLLIRLHVAEVADIVDFEQPQLFTSFDIGCGYVATILLEAAALPELDGLVANPVEGNRLDGVGSSALFVRRDCDVLHGDKAGR